MMRSVTIDGETHEVSGEPFVVGEWVAAQDEHGRYIQGNVSKTGAGVVSIKEEGVGPTGRRPIFTVPEERIYERHPAGYKSSTAP